MKKIFLTLVVALMATVCFAKADDKQLQLVEKGGVAAIFDSSKKANIEFVFSENCTASYQGATNIPFKSYVDLNKEWNEEWAESSAGFREDWNSRNKKGMLIVDGEADYTIRVTINAFKEMASFGGVWWEITDGSVEIISKADNQLAVSFKIHEYYEICTGFKAMKLRNRIEETIEGLSESCLKFAKKANK